MAHLHFGVVHHVDEVEDEGAVGAAHHHVRGVGFLAVVDGDLAADQVVHGDRFAFEAEAPGTLVLVDPSGFAQFLEPALVDVLALGLEIRTVGAIRPGSLLPVESQPAQSVQDGGTGFFGITGLVRIFDPQDEGPAVPPGEEPVEEGGAGPAHVQVAGGRGGEAGADRARHRLGIAPDDGTRNGGWGGRADFGGTGGIGWEPGMEGLSRKIPARAESPIHRFPTVLR